MEQTKINEILELHKKWLNNEPDGVRADLSDANLRSADLRSADLSCADLSDADLRGADLSCADLDFSCLPLWCGGLGVHIDDRQAKQLLYHLIRNVQYSKNVSDEVKAIICTPESITLANEFHRVNECGEITIEGKSNE